MSLRGSGLERTGHESKEVLPCFVADCVLLFKADQELDPVSCFPESYKKSNIIPGIYAFCFPSPVTRPSVVVNESTTSKPSYTLWEYHNFATQGEQGLKTYGHVLRFTDPALGPDVPPGTPLKFAYAYSRLFHCSYFLVPFMPGVGFLFADNQSSFDTMKRWLVHTCKEMYASEVDSTGKRWRVQLETRIISLVTEVAAPQSVELSTQLLLSCNTPSTRGPANRNSSVLNFRLPINQKQLPPIDVNMRLLFSCLDIPNIVTAFEGLIVGQQILFLSKSAALLSYVAESLLSLLWPFSWPFTYIPVFNSALPIDFLSSMTPYVFGMLKSYPDLPDITGLFDLNQSILVIDIDENRVYKTQKVFHLPVDVRSRLMDRLRSITQPDVLSCDLAETTPATIDPKQYQNGIREAFFRVFLEIFEGVDFRNTTAFLEEAGDSQARKEIKMFNTNLQSNSPVFQFFLDYLSSHMDNMLLILLRDPSKVAEALKQCFQEPTICFAIQEGPIHKVEVRSHYDLAPWDSRLFLVPRYDTIIKQLDGLINESNGRIDRHLLRIFYNVKQGGRAQPTISGIRELSKLHPTHPILECKDLFMSLFTELTQGELDKLASETDKIGDWARSYILKEKTRTQQRIVTPELAVLFQEIAMRDDNSAPEFIDLVKRALTSLNVVKEGMTVLTTAAAEGKPKMCYALLQVGASPDVEGTSGSPIHYVTSPRTKPRNEVQHLLWVRVLGMLLARGQNIDAQDIYLCTALMRNCQRTNPALGLTKFLLQNGADPHISDLSKLMPMSCLTVKKSNIEFGDAEAYMLLLEYGTNPMLCGQQLADFDTVLGSVKAFLDREPNNARISNLFNQLTAKREQYRKATQYSAAPNDMVKLGGIGRSDSKPQNLAVTRSHTEYSLSHFGICEAQFHHLIKLHVLCHAYFDLLDSPIPHINKKEKLLVEQLVVLRKTLRELLDGHATLNAEIRKNNGIYGVTRESRNISALIQPFMSYFNTYYPTFAMDLYDRVDIDSFAKSLNESDNLKKFFDTIAVQQCRIIKTTFFFGTTPAHVSLIQLLRDVVEFPTQFSVLFEDLALKVDRTSEEYGILNPLCNHLENLRNKIWQITQTSFTKRIFGVEGSDHDLLKRGTLLVHQGPLSQIKLADSTDGYSEVRKQDIIPRYAYLFSLSSDQQKGCMVICEETMVNGKPAHNMKELVYLKDSLPFDIPPFQHPDGRESCATMFQVVGSKKQQCLILSAPAKSDKEKWVTMLWRLCVEGNSYSRAMGKYILFKRFSPGAPTYEGYLDYRFESHSRYIPWKTHYVVFRKDTLYAFHSSHDMSEPILIVRLLEYELSLDGVAKTVILSPHTFSSSKLVLKIGEFPKAMSKPDVTMDWQSVLTSFYQALRDSKTPTGNSAGGASNPVPSVSGAPSPVPERAPSALQLPSSPPTSPGRATLMDSTKLSV